MLKREKKEKILLEKRKNNIKNISNSNKRRPRPSFVI